VEELQRDCRKLLQHEDLLRAQHRHEQAIQRQNEEMKQRHIEESKHIIARYLSAFFASIDRLVLRKFSCQFACIYEGDIFQLDVWLISDAIWA